MFKLIQSIIEYLKLFLREWYLFLGMIPSLLSNLDFYSQYKFTIPIEYTFVYVAIVFIIASYRIWSKARKKIERPKVIVDYDLTSFNICYLCIKNIGNDYARNIQTTFNPNIKIGSDVKVNESKFCKNLSQLAPGKSIRFFFGTFTEPNILKQFNIQIIYYDLDGKEKYVTNQVIDPGVFIGTASYEKESEIVKELKEIGSYLKKLDGHVSEIPTFIKTGINIRNSNLEDLSESELRTLLHNIYFYGTDEDFFLTPFVNDTRQVIKYLRDKIMLRGRLEEDDKLFLKNLNKLHNYQPYLGSDKFRENVKVLFGENAR